VRGGEKGGKGDKLQQHLLIFVHCHILGMVQRGGGAGKEEINIVTNSVDNQLFLMTYSIQEFPIILGEKEKKKKKERKKRRGPNSDWSNC